MYKVVNIRWYQATRDVELLNEDTGTVDLCFDDSAVVSDTNFYFMEEQESYDCKIALLGSFVPLGSKSGVKVKVVDSDVTVGNGHFLVVLIGEDIYYIPQGDARNIDLKGDLLYTFTRKDLIQVDDVIHGDYLSD